MRHQDWVANLWRVIERHYGVPFEHGKHDCCLFVARCIDAMTGSTHTSDLAYHYYDEKSAHAFLRAEGGMRRAVSGFLGEPVAGLPRRGDVALVRTEDGEGVGVCVGPTIAVAAERGIVFYPLGESIVSWRVD